ncbi:MAG: acyl-homoserine-lactone synthase [Pseudoalteromonas distincta]
MLTHRLTRYFEIPESLAIEIFAARKSIFCDRLGWAIPCDGEYEMDLHDLPQTLILVSTNSSNRLAGYARLLPANECCMLDTVLRFPNVDQSAREGYYEISRFFLMRNRAVISNRLTAGDFFRELILAAESLGAKGYLAAVDSKMLACLKRCGWEYRHISSRFGSAGDFVYLISLPVDGAALAKVSSMSGSAKKVLSIACEA